MCTYLCIHLHCACKFHIKKHRKPKKEEKCVCYGCVLCCVVWCCVVRNTKMQEILGTLSKHGLRFWHDMVNHGPSKRSENGHFPRRIVFTLTFSDNRFYSKRPKRHFFTGGPVPKVLIVRWKRSQPPKHTVPSGSQILGVERCRPSCTFVALLVPSRVCCICP